MERLFADMEESIVAQKAVMDNNDAGITAMDYFLDQLSAGSFDDIDSEKAKVGINSFGYVAVPSTNVVTLRELQSTGSMTLIKDVSVRESIGRVELSLVEAEFSAATNLSLISAIIPKVASWTYYATVDQESGFHAIASGDGYADIQNPGFDRMLASPDALQLISWMSAWSKYNAIVLAQHHEATLELRDLLRERLEQ
jgi:hypothetical protein